MSSERLYMLDTNTCSYLMRGSPVVRQRLIDAEARGARLTISAIVYSELRDGALGPRALPRHVRMVAEFIRCLDGVLPWDKDAAEQTALIRQALRQAGTPISPNDSAIAGHCLAIGATLITNNMREFGRVNGLQVEDWADQSS